MQSMISYIYEYENERRIRNAGFLKIQTTGTACTVNLHIKSPLIRSGEPWKLYAFHSDGSSCTLYPLTELSGEQRAFNVRIAVTGEQFPDGITLDSVEGFWISNNGSRIFAAAWKPTFVDSSKFQIWEEKTQPETEIEAETSVSDTENKTGNDTPVTAASADCHCQSGCQNDSARDDKPNCGCADKSTKRDNCSCSDEPEKNDNCDCSNNPRNINCRKIQRQDMTTLPRREWYLANNSFLLHGYYNYHHLILVEDNGTLFLGVPGIYDRRENRAAELFGFPRFSSEYASLVELEEDECNPNGQFGYWLRRIRR